MVTVVISGQTCELSDKQVSWFKTLSLVREHKIIELPSMISGKTIGIDQLIKLVDSYQHQIEYDLIDYKRPRSLFEHYLGGVLDDEDGQIEKLLDLVISKLNRVVDYELYQLVSKCNAIKSYTPVCYGCWNM